MWGHVLIGKELLVIFRFWDEETGLSSLILFHLANSITALPGRRESILHAERSQR